MKKQAFSSEKYLNLQRDHILERINQFDGKLYLEFGGKMLEDFHAARVLPGYEPDNKIKLLQELKEQVEVVIAINASNIEHSKARGDLGISYDQEVLRLIDKFNELGIFVGSVVITQYAGQPAAETITVIPRCNLMLFSSCKIILAFLSSRLLVGSSAKIIFGFNSNARAMQARSACPPET